MALRPGAGATAFVVATLLLSAPAGAASAVEEDDVVEIYHRGITFLGMPPVRHAVYDVAIVDTYVAVDNIVRAFDLLMTRSRLSAHAINALRRNGEVVVLYDPAFPLDDADSAVVEHAAYIPDLYDDFVDTTTETVFPVVLGRYIVKWPRAELAGVLAHELAGHGFQHLRGRLDRLRPSDVECEAYLYEEQAHQDMGTPKLTREMVAFRQQLEWRWCANFKRYIKGRVPALAALWERRDPNVPRLLELFDEYLLNTIR